MPITVERTLYQFDELSDKAKDKARDWWRSCRDASDLENVVEDFAEIAGKLGVTLATHEVRLMSGKTRQDPSVSWSVGYTQSDFAAFDGRYSYVKGEAAAIKEYAPTDTALHSIADRLQAVQARHLYGLSATIKYHHYYGLQVEVRNDRHQYGEVAEDVDSEVTEAMRDLARWLYDSLRKEDEYQSSDDYIAEAMEANEYTFTEDGRREEP